MVYGCGEKVLVDKISNGCLNGRKEEKSWIAGENGGGEARKNGGGGGGDLGEKFRSREDV